MGNPVSAYTRILPLAAAILATGCSSQPAATPAPSDFAISIQVLSKKCFGSAGCVLTYRIQPTYTGPTLDDDQELTVTYEVSGGEDAHIDSFEVKGARVRHDRRDVIRTSSSASTLSARVTRVS